MRSSSYSSSSTRTTFIRVRPRRHHNNSLSPHRPRNAVGEAALVYSVLKAVFYELVIASAGNARSRGQTEGCVFLRYDI